MRYNAARRASVGSMFGTLIMRLSLNSKNKMQVVKKNPDTLRVPGFVGVGAVGII